MALRELVLEVLDSHRGLAALPWTSWVLLALAAAVAARVWHAWSVYVDVPAVGVPPGLLGPWKAALQWVTQSEMLLREGLRVHGPTGTTFKVSTPARYLVFITSPKLLAEIKDSEETLSFNAAGAERIQMQYTLHPSLQTDPYHLEIISKKMTQSLATVLPDVVQEITMAFEDGVEIGDEWTIVPIYNLMLQCVSRATNRLFVGLPLCRDPTYLSRVIAFASTLSRAGQTIDMFPSFLKPFAAWYVLDNGRAFATIMSDVGPLFTARRQPGAERKNDAIQWILDTAPPGATLTDMCRRILFLNFAAIHTSSITLTHALLDLASAPHHLAPLRKEIEESLKTYGGWTKPALTAMKKLDSVLRESQRLNGVTIGTVMRKATRATTLSDGTHLPRGTVVMSPASAIHHSPETYGDAAGKFDGFRWARMRETPGQEARHQAVSTDGTYLAFGHGRHACPGRFFAANELKVLLAYMIGNFDFELAEGDKAARPENRYYGLSCLPDFGTRLRFRRCEGGRESLVNQGFGRE
ncbi:cytochrome P450 [Geopyxis carbonaria]|nr:cytochrome P450 [Geopyxis carbonaria]